MEIVTFLWGLVQCAVALWIGLFVLTRDWNEMRSRAVGGALVTWSLVPFGQAMLAVSTPPAAARWLPLIVGAWPITVGFLFGVAFTYVTARAPVGWQATFHNIGRGVGIVGLLLGCLAAITNRIYDYSSLLPNGANFIDGNFGRFGPLKPLYTLYLAAVPLAIIIIALLEWRRDRSRGIACATAGALSWGAALTIQAIIARTVAPSPAPSPLLLTLALPLFILGFALLAWAIFRHHAILSQALLQNDLLTALVELGLILTLFSLLPTLIARLFGPLSAAVCFAILAATVLAILLSHLRLPIRRIIDGQLSPAAVPTSAAGDADDDASAVDYAALIDATVNKQLLRTIHSAEKFNTLAHSPLQTLPVIQNSLPANPTDRQKATAVVTLLHRALDRLGRDPAAVSSQRDEMLHILNYRVRDNLSRADITARLHIHPRKYDRLLAEGVRLLGDAIVELSD